MWIRNHLMQSVFDNKKMACRKFKSPVSFDGFSGLANSVTRSIEDIDKFFVPNLSLIEGVPRIPGLRATFRAVNDGSMCTRCMAALA